MAHDQTSVSHTPDTSVDTPNYYSGETADNFTGYQHLAPVTHALWLYVSPVLFIVGFLGNVFCLIVLNSKRMRQSRCHFALSALACTDTSVLCIGLLRNWFKSGLLIGEIRATSDVMCKIHSFLSYGSRHMSSWTLMFLAVERLVSVYSPFKAKEWLSKKRTVILWCCILALISLLDAPLFVGREIQTYLAWDGQQGDEVEFKVCYWTSSVFKLAFWWMDFALLCGIPFCVLGPCNILIVAKIGCGRRMQKELQRSCAVHGNARQTRQVSSVTLMLLSVCVAFVVTTIPITAFFLAGPGFWNRMDHDLMQFLFALCNLLYYTNTATNFILYYLGGSQFRQAAFDVMCCLQVCRHHKKKEPLPSTGSEVLTAPILRKESSASVVNKGHLVRETAP